jgi:hypothetical protein
MKNSEVVRNALSAIERHDFDGLSKLVAEDLAFVGPMPTPLNKREYLSLIRGLTTGFPDWRFNARDWQEAGETVSAKVRITGTHSRELPALMPGMPAAAASNKSFELPEERVEFQVRDGKIGRWQLNAPPGGGVQGILSQLGIAVPVR